MAEQNHDWGEAAIEQNRQWMMRYLVSCTGNMTAAEDICQDIFRIAYEKRDSFTPGTNFGAWLRGIARNRLKQHYDRSRRTQIVPDACLDVLNSVAAESEADSLDQEWHRQRLSALNECLRLLQKKVQQILHMRYGEGRSGREIARELDIKPQQVNWMAFSARKALFACIEERVSS